MDPDPGATELDSSSVTHRNEPDNQIQDQDQDQDLDPVLVWVPSGRRLISGLLGINVVLLGAALVAGQAFNPEGLKHQEPLVFMLLLMGVGLVWMLWYLMWARKQPGISPHKDHHAGGITVLCKVLCKTTIMTTCTEHFTDVCLCPVSVVLVLFAAASLLLYVCRIGYLLSVRACNPPAKVLSPFIEAPFLAMQVMFVFCCCFTQSITRCNKRKKKKVEKLEF